MFRSLIQRSGQDRIPGSVKKAVSILVLITVLSGTFYGCASGSPASSAGPDSGKANTSLSSQSDADRDTERVPVDSALAALDYGGREINILNRIGSSYDAEIFPDELRNDPVDDSIYNSIKSVEEMLNVHIGSTRKNNPDVNSAVATMISSGDQTYDIVIGSVYYTIPMLTNGYMYNLLDNGIDTYLDPDSIWWPRYWLDEAMLGKDYLYSITGAPALSLYKCIFATFYNKSLGERLGIENLYDVVESGKWTLDFLSELVSPLYSSLNGDDYRDEEDQYGLIMDNYVHCDIFWSSCDFSLVERDDEGWFETTTADKDKISRVFDWLLENIYSNHGVYFDEENEHGSKVFTSGNALLGFFHLADAESSSFRNMQDDYGILPTPKYDEHQKQYYSYSHDQYNVFMIPKTVRDPEMSGAVIESMAYEYYCFVHPVYYDVVLKGRYANDPESRQMLDRITQNIKIDPCWIYAVALNEPCANVLRTPIMNHVNTFASNFSNVTKRLPALLNGLRKTFENLGY